MESLPALPSVRCVLSIEKLNAGVGSKDLIKSATLTLARNEFRDLLLVVESGGGEMKKKFRLRQEELVIHRRFAKEGKCSISSKALNVMFVISNAPPHQLAVFLKSLAAKLAGASGEAISIRQRLLSTVPNALEDISPVTLKDVHNLKVSEAGAKGLLKMIMSPLTSGRTKKRTRLSQKQVEEEEEVENNDDKENVDCKRQRSGLTEEQRYVLQAVMDGRNVFFTGGAGVGKSFLIRKCIGTLPPDSTFVTASTGVAAYQIGGMTLHSFAGIGSGSAPLDTCLEKAVKTRAVSDVWRRCKHLIIDEISMVDGQFFTKLEAVARYVRGCEKPFGGIQLILAGDFCQLPPVTKGKEARRFCFETSAWRRSVHVNIELTCVKRQTDAKFIKILGELRKGKCSEESEKVLKATRLNVIEKNGVTATKLCTHTDDARHINAVALAALPDQEKIFSAVDSDPALSSFMDAHTPVETKLRLKIGAQVMLVRNRVLSQGLVNGARGCVKEFDKASGNPVVAFTSGTTEVVHPEKWAVKSGGGLILTRRQLPLKLAWAFSIHKSQGMTLDCAEISLGRVFECGQAYVALSRAKDLKSVRVVDFNASCIQADQRVLRFYRDIQLTTPTAITDGDEHL